ncbi:M1 family metallopeptidase [Candidatus Chloroploca asiatica]|nr:M1 family metallopeptidase [Candidatus Chloroploca asiatica]
MLLPQMRFWLLMLLLVLMLLLTSCTPFVAAQRRDPPPVPDLLAPAALAVVQPSTVVAEYETASADRQAKPTPTPTAALFADDPFVAAQVAAMLPAYVTDLEQAAAWERYTIVAALSPGEQRVRGRMQVLVTNRTATPHPRLVFHLYPNHPDFGGRLDVTSATINGVPVASGTAYDDSLFWLELAQPLLPGATVEVEMSFVARTPRNASARTFGAFNQEAGLWSMANFYPILARQRPEGGWDERPIESRGDFVVSSTALYDVTIDVPVEWTLVTTGVGVAREAVTPGVRRERFVSGPQREFYLGATRGLAQVSSDVAGTRIISHYQPAHAEAGKRALQVTEQALRIFNARYGQYPLAELEVIEGAMTTFLGMEYPGVVLIDQQLYARNARGLETTVAHEIAHQWWYSLVGNDAQGEAWLDEGMASYAQILYYEGIGAFDVALSELEGFRDMYRQVRERGRDVPLATPPSELRGIYVPIVYGKGALFFHALRAEIGEAAFTRFLQNYYAFGRYRDLVGDDLLRVAEEACGCDLDRLYRDWVLTAAPVL